MSRYTSSTPSEHKSGNIFSGNRGSIAVTFPPLLEIASLGERASAQLPAFPPRNNNPGVNGSAVCHEDRAVRSRFCPGWRVYSSLVSSLGTSKRGQERITQPCVTPIPLSLSPPSTRAQTRSSPPSSPSLLFLFFSFRFLYSPYTHVHVYTR